MISSFDYYKQVENPDVYLCNPDKRIIGALKCNNKHLVLRFNDLSEISFTVPKIKEKEKDYELIKSKRLLFVDKIGWFQIENVNESVEGGNCSKEVRAQSHQCMFKNRGFVAEERTYMFYNPYDEYDDEYDSSNTAAIPSVVGQLCKQLGIKVCLDGDKDVAEDKIDWTITYIDPSLKFNAKNNVDIYTPATGSDNICRGLKEREDLNGYDFIINEVEKAFEVIFEFDFLYHTIKVKTLEDVTKPTNIYLSFDNLVNSIEISENADDIVTVMSCEGNDIDIRTVNPMGTNYIVNFDYYKQTVQGQDGKTEYPWMSKELIDALNDWEIEFDKWQEDDESRVGHDRKYSYYVDEIQKLYTEKSEIEAEIRFANLKITDFQNAIGKNAGNNNEPVPEDGYITAETVKIDENSLSANSAFYENIFTDSVTIVGHKSAPIPNKDEENRYKFSFSDAGQEKTPKWLIQNFISSDSEEQQGDIYLYFMDGDDYSYCKLSVESYIGVVKDDNGNISADGAVEIDGETYRVKVDGDEFFVMSNGGTIIASGNISQSNSYFIYDDSRYRIVKSSDGIVSVYKFYVSGFERYTTYQELPGDDGWCTIWENHLNNDIIPLNESLQKDIDVIDAELKYINAQCNIETFVQKRGQNLYDELSNYWIEGSYKNDNIVAYDTTTMSERIDLAKQLMDSGEKDLVKASQPQFEMTVDAINFTKIYEFRQFSQELILGRVVTIEKEDGVYYSPALMSIEYDLDVADSFSMTFSNASKPGDTAMTFADLIKESSSVSRTVAANWSNLTDYSRNKEDITSLIMAPLDRTLRAAQGNMSRQQFIVDDTGILGRKYTDNSDTGFSPKQMRILNNVLIFTDDNWSTAKTALGSIIYTNDQGENVEAYGLIAEAIIGDLILGRELQIRNDSGTILLNEDGILIKNDGGEAVFEADHYGNLAIVGEIVATKLTLRDGVTIGYDHVSNAPDPKGFIFTIDQDKRATLNTNADSIALSSGQLSITSMNFTLDTDGKITAKGAHIEGEIEAEGGSIGGFTIGKTSLYNGFDSMSRSDGADGVYLGVDGINIGGGNFTISKSGVLQTKKGEILLGEKSTSTDKVDDYYIRLTPGTLTTLLETAYGGNKKDSFGATLSYGSLDMHHTDALELYGGGTNYLHIDTRGDGEYTPSGSYVQATTEGSHLASLTLEASVNYNSSYIRLSATPDAINSWMTLFAVNGTLEGTWKLSDGPAITSDRQHKNSIETLDDKYEQLFDALTPVRFKYNEGTSGRYHTGFIAQDVKDAVRLCGLDSNEFAAYLDITNEKGETTCCLRYDEFIALCVEEIQKLKERVALLEEKLMKQ